MSTARDRIDLLREALRALVQHFNDRSEWDAALRAQTALVQVDHIFGADDTEFEAEVDP
jgi:hypothetical protein